MAEGEREKLLSLPKKRERLLEKKASEWFSEYVIPRIELRLAEVNQKSSVTNIDTTLLERNFLRKFFEWTGPTKSFRVRIEDVLEVIIVGATDLSDDMFGKMISGNREVAKNIIVEAVREAYQSLNTTRGQVVDLPSSSEE